MSTMQPEKILIADRVEKYIGAARRSLSAIDRNAPWVSRCDELLRAAIVQLVDGHVQSEQMVVAMNAHGQLIDIDTGEQVSVEKGNDGAALIACRVDQVVRQ